MIPADVTIKPWERALGILLVAVGVGILAPVAILLALQMGGYAPNPLLVIVPFVGLAVVGASQIWQER